MLARKAVVGQVKGDVLVATQGRKRSANVALDLRPMMCSCIWYCRISCIFAYHDGYECIQHKIGYEVVKTQQAVVQLTKDNDALDVEVASLKSPVRIQQIAEEQLGMVLPDSFVYSTKSAVTERNVQEKQQIID